MLAKMIGTFSIVEHNEDDTEKKVRGRFAEIIFDEEVTIEYGNIEEKQNRYQQMLTDMLIDQWDWIKNKDHIRIIDDNNAVESIRMAEEARKIAQKF